MLLLELLMMVFHFEVIFVLNLLQMVRVMIQALPTFTLGMALFGVNSRSSLLKMEQQMITLVGQ